MVCIAGALLGINISKTYSIVFVPAIIFLAVFPFINIKYSIYTLVFLIPFEELIAFRGATLIKFWGIYVLAVYIVQNISESKNLGFETSLVHKVALLLLPLSILSEYFAIDKVAGLSGIITQTQVIVFSIVVYTSVKRQAERILLARIFLIACVTVSLLQALQYFDISTFSFLEVEPTPEGRMQGYTGDPNRFGMMLLSALYLGIASIAFSRNLFWKSITLIGILILIFTIGITISRAIIFTFIFSFLIFAAWQFYKGKQIRFSILLALCIIVIAFLQITKTNEQHLVAMRQNIVRRFTLLATHHSPSTEARMEMARVGVNMILANPLGVGPGNFSRGALRLVEIRRDAHNSILEVGGELGFPGLACFLIMIFLAIKPFFSKTNSTADNFEKIIIFSLGVFFIASLSLSAIRSKVFWFLIGLAAASGEHIKNPEIEM